MNIKNQFFTYKNHFSSAKNKFKKKMDEIGPYLKEAKRYKGLLAQIIDVIIHKLFINTNPVDYYRYQFYKGNKSWKEKSYYVGKSGSMYFPYDKNHIKYIPLFDNKHLFKIMLQGFDLPQPRLLSTIGQTFEINTEEKLYSFLSSTDFDILIKPMEGSGGEGILLLTHKDGEFYSEGKLFPKEKIWAYIQKEKLDYIIEERVVQKKYISSIYSLSLNTFRIITIKTNDNKWHVICSYMRIGSGGREVDNSGVGGITIGINHSGETIYAYDWTQKSEISHHPDTGKGLIGIKLDGYDKVIDLVLDASKKFSFMGTIGWDIGLSEEGPVIIEGNPFFDSSYAQIKQRPLLTYEIAGSLKKHYIWTRWDKSRIYPRLRNPKLRYRYFK